MPRYNVQHPVTKEWSCFSTIVDDYVTDWMDEERYQKWRLEEYGKFAGEIRDANLMDYEEADQRIVDRKMVGRRKNRGRRHEQVHLRNKTRL